MGRFARAARQLDIRRAFALQIQGAEGGRVEKISCTVVCREQVLHGDAQLRITVTDATQGVKSALLRQLDDFLED